MAAPKRRLVVAVRSRGDRGEVNEVEIAKIESQTAKYKVHNFLLKAKYKPPDGPLKQSSNSSLIYRFES